jgi:hypothetical protein
LQIGFQSWYQRAVEDGCAAMGIMIRKLDIGVLIQVFTSVNGRDVKDHPVEGQYVTPSTALSQSRHTTSEAMLSRVHVSYLAALQTRR